MKATVILVAIAIAAVRPFLPTHPVSLQGSYEAVAHMVVGGIIGAWIVSRARWLLFTAIGLSVVEVVCAAIGALH